MCARALPTVPGALPEEGWQLQGFESQPEVTIPQTS